MSQSNPIYVYVHWCISENIFKWVIILIVKFITYNIMYLCIIHEKGISINI